MRYILVTVFTLGLGLSGLISEVDARDGELCWVRINQETIYGQTRDGICRFTEIRIKGEKLKEGRPYIHKKKEKAADTTIGSPDANKLAG